MDIQKRLVTAAHKFEQACQLPCIALDAESNTLYDSTDEHRPLCSCIMEEADVLRLPCNHVHYYGCMQASQNGGKYVYYCPMGLTHFIAPLVVHGHLMGSLVGGPLIISDKEDYLQSAGMEKYSKSELGKETLKRLADTIPCVTSERVSALCEILLSLAREIEAELEDLPEPDSIILPFVNEMRNAELYPLEAEQQLMAAVRLGNTRAAAVQLAVWLERLSDCNLKSLNSYCCELGTLAARNAIECGADEALTLENSRQFINRLRVSKEYDQTVRHVNSMVASMAGYVYELSSIRHSDSIFKALTYVTQNFDRKITLEDVAGAAFLSPTYFSKVFKDEMKIPFSQYLNKVRIEAGKKLLVTSRLTMGEICNRVGFEEQSYFTKVFKKLTGMTPLRYREQTEKLEEPSA